MLCTDRLCACTAAAGERWCSVGHHQVSIEACTNPDGEVMASCVHCCQRHQNEHTAADNLAPDINDVLLGPVEGIEDGLDVDNEFRDMQWMMDIDLPDDSAVTVMEKAWHENFRH